MPSKKTPSKTAAGSKKAPVSAAAAAPAAAVSVATEPFEAAAAANQETFETVLKAGTQAAAKGYEQAVALAQEQVEQASQTLFRRYDEAASFSRDNVDAYVQSSTLFAKGVESLSKELMTIAQSAVEANVATTRALFGAKSVREVIDLQTEFSRSRFDALVAESAKLAELGMTLASETIEPIQARLNATVEKFVKPAAA